MNSEFIQQATYYTKIDSSFSLLYLSYGQLGSNSNVPCNYIENNSNSLHML